MYNRDTIIEKNITLAFEFERYLLDHPEMLERIPDEAEVVLLPKDDPELYRVNLEEARRKQRKVTHRVVLIEIDALTPPRSRLVNPQLATI
jgi:hypothetical protein